METKKLDPAWLLGEKFKDSIFVLADNSEARMKLLHRIGIAPKMIKSNFQAEKLYEIGLSPNVLVRTVAEESARDVSTQLKNNHESYDIVLGFHTLAIFNNKIIRKPSNRDEALTVLKQLNGRWHSVLTGVTLFHSSEAFETFAVETKVKFADISEEILQAYIKSDEWIDQFAAYNANGYGSSFIESNNGCFFNIVGVPLSEIAKRVRRIMNDNEGSKPAQQGEPTEAQSESITFPEGNSPPKSEQTASLSSIPFAESLTAAQNHGSITPAIFSDVIAASDHSIIEESSDDFIICDRKSESSNGQVESASNENISPAPLPPLLPSTTFQQTSVLHSQQSQSNDSLFSVATTQCSSCANSGSNPQPELIMHGHPQSSTPEIQQNVEVPSTQSVVSKETVGTEFSVRGGRFTSRGGGVMNTALGGKSSIEQRESDYQSSTLGTEDVGSDFFIPVCEQTSDQNNNIAALGNPSLEEDNAARVDSCLPAKESQSVVSTTAPVISPSLIRVSPQPKFILYENPHPLPPPPTIQQNVQVPHSNPSIDSTTTTVGNEFSMRGVRFIARGGESNVATPRFQRGGGSTGMNSARGGNSTFTQRGGFKQHSYNPPNENQNVGSTTPQIMSQYSVRGNSYGAPNSLRGGFSRGTTHRGFQAPSMNAAVSSQNGPLTPSSVRSQNSTFSTRGNSFSSTRGGFHNNISAPSVHVEPIYANSNAQLPETSSVRSQNSTFSTRGNSFSSNRGGFYNNNNISAPSSSVQVQPVYANSSAQPLETQSALTQPLQPAFVHPNEAALPSNEIQNVNPAIQGQGAQIFSNDPSSNPPLPTRRRFYQAPSAAAPAPEAPPSQVSSTYSLQSAATQASDYPATPDANIASNDGTINPKIIRDEYSTTFFRATGVPGLHDLRRAGIVPPKPVFNPKHSYKYSNQDDWG